MTKRQRSDGPKCAVAGIPLGDLPAEGYIQRTVDLKLSEAHARTLRRILIGLQGAGEELDGGRPIRTSADAIRRVLELIDRSAG